MNTTTTTANSKHVRATAGHSQGLNNATIAARIDRALLAVCTLSFLIYLIRSDAVRAFFNEVVRLSDKL